MLEEVIGGGGGGEGRGKFSSPQSFNREGV